MKNIQSFPSLQTQIIFLIQKKVYMSQEINILDGKIVKIMIPKKMCMTLIILVIILFSLLVSGITIAMASKSKNFKEAQSALSPLNVIVMLPGFYAFYAEVKTTLITSIIPLLNIHMIFNDVVAGNINMLHISLMVITTIIFIALILSYIIKQYKSFFCSAINLSSLSSNM